MVHSDNGSQAETPYKKLFNLTLMLLCDTV